MLSILRERSFILFFKNIFFNLSVSSFLNPLDVVAALTVSSFAFLFFDVHRVFKQHRWRISTSRSVQKSIDRYDPLRQISCIFGIVPVCTRVRGNTMRSAIRRSRSWPSQEFLESFERRSRGRSSSGRREGDSVGVLVEHFAHVRINQRRYYR